MSISLRPQSTTAIWKNEMDEILFKEEILTVDLPPVNREIIWSGRRWKVVKVIENFDEKTSSVIIEDLTE